MYNAANVLPVTDRRDTSVASLAAPTVPAGYGRPPVGRPLDGSQIAGSRIMAAWRESVVTLS